MIWGEIKKMLDNAVNKAKGASRHIEIIPDHLPPCRFANPDLPNKDVRAVVVHWFENAGQSAKSCRFWLVSQCNPAQLKKWSISHGRFGSAHDAIDLDGKVFEWIPQDRVAYSVGGRVTEKARLALGSNLNHHTVSIELAHPDWSGRPTPETYESAVRLAAHRLRQHSLNEANLWLHTEITGKGLTNGRPCHKWFFDNPYEWALFKERVKGLL